MKIAIINPWSVSDKSIGGTERFVMDLAEVLKRNQHEVDVYMFSGESHISNGINYININLFDIEGDADEYIVQSSFGKFDTEDSYNNLALKLESKIDVSKYDYIQLNSQLFLNAWKWKKRIFTIHTNPYEYELAWGKKSYEKMLEVMHQYSNDSNTIFVAPSKYYSDEYYKLSGCKINYIPHAIEVERVQADDNEKAILNKYKLDKNKINIVDPSRLEPLQKQPMLLIDACCLLNDEEKNKIQIIFTGLDKQYVQFMDELMEKSEKNNLNVKILRFDKMSEVYKIANLVVLPSKSESFGYSALESLSLGIPTILNNIPTFNEIAIGNNYCEIFNNSHIELKDKISKFISNSEWNTRKMPNEEWVKKYSFETFGKSYLSYMK